MHSRHLSTRLVSVAAIVTIVSGHFISASNLQEVYVICATSYYIRLVSFIAGPNASAGMFLGSIGFTGVMFVLIGLFAGTLSAGIVLSVGHLCWPKSSERLLRATGVVYGILTLGMSIGLFLTFANRTLKNFRGADKIYVHPAYFLLPAMFALFAIFYYWRFASARPNQSSYPTPAFRLRG